MPAAPAQLSPAEDAEILYQNDMGLGLEGLGAKFPKLTYGQISLALARARKARIHERNSAPIDFCGPRPVIEAP